MVTVENENGMLLDSINTSSSSASFRHPNIACSTFSLRAFNEAGVSNLSYIDPNFTGMHHHGGYNDV